MSVSKFLLRLTVLLLFISILASERTISQNESKISLQKVWKVGGPETEVFFDYINNIAVDHYNRIYVSDFGKQKILVFDQKGNIINKIGRRGRGPGEFLLIRNIAIANNKLFVFDTDLLRLSTFKITEEDIYYQTEVLLPQLKSPDKFGRVAYRPSWLYALDGNEYIIKYSVPYSPGSGEFKRKQKLVHFKTGKNYQDLVLKFRERQWFVYDDGSSLFVSSMPFGRKPVLEIADGGLIYLGWSGEPVIKIYNLSGKLIDKVSFSYEPVEVSNAVLEKKVSSKDDARFRDELKGAAPDTWPVYHWIEVDKNRRLWIAVNAEDADTYSLHIFNKEGELIGKTSLPKSVELQVIQAGYAYGIHENENGVQSVVKYKIKGLN